MDSEIVQSFNKLLYSMYDARPPISKQKIFDITKAAMNAIRYFKHVVAIIEKFLVKCRNEYKISGLYVIDSIIRQARKQYKYKDVYAPRFAINLQNTFINILSCDVIERVITFIFVIPCSPKAVRVINLWLANKIFDDDVIEPLLQHCRATGLEVDTEKVEMIVKGDKANMQIYGAEAPAFPISPTKKAPQSIVGKKMPKTPPKPRTPPIELRPQTPPMEESSFEIDHDRSLNDRDILNLLENHDLHLAKVASGDKVLLNRIYKIINDRITEKLEIERRRQGNIKNLLSREFDYSDEEDDDDFRMKTESGLDLNSRENLLATAKSLFIDGSLSQDLHQLNQEILHRQRPRTPPLPQQLPVVPRTISHPFNFPSKQFSATLPIGVPPPAMAGGNLPLPFVPYMPLQHSLAPPGVEPSSSYDQSSVQKINTFQNAEKSYRKRAKSRSAERDHDFREIRLPRNDTDDPRKRDRSNDDPRNRRDRTDRRVNSSSDRKQRRSRSPVVSNVSSHRDREREYRDRGKSREKERGDHRSRNDEEKVRDKERERRKNGLPTRPKEAHVLIASRTLWFGRIPANCAEADICDSVKNAGLPEKINIVAPRACAYVTMKERRAAFKIIDRLAKDLQIQKKTVKLSWATIQGLKDNERLMDYWDMDRGIALIPFSKLPEPLDSLLDGAYLDVDTLPSHLKSLYDSKGSKGRGNLMLDQTQAQIPLPSATANIPQNLPLPGAIFPNVSNFPPGNMFNFPQQMNIPPPFAPPNTAATVLNSANSITAASGTTATDQQQLSANAATIAGMAAFAGFPPPGGPSFPPFGAPSAAAAAAAAAFLSGTSLPQFPLPSSAVLNSQVSKPVVTSANNLPFIKNQFNTGGNFPNTSFNNNSGRGSFRFGQRGGGDYGNRGRSRGGFGNNQGDYQQQKSGFHGGQRGGSWSGGNRDRFQNQNNSAESVPSGEVSSSDFGNGFTSGRGSRLGNNNFYNNGRGRGGPQGGRFNSYNNNSNRTLLQTNFEGNGQQNQNIITVDVTDKGLHHETHFSNNDSTQKSSTTNADTSQIEIPTRLINTGPGLLCAFASTAADAVPVLEDDKHLSASVTLPNLSSISIPQLSAATISNLREIIGATSSVPSTAAKVDDNVSNTNINVDDNSDEYDDNDEEYFRAFDLRQKGADVNCVSTTQSTVAAKLTEENDHQHQMDAEVSSTTLYDEHDHRPTVSSNEEDLLDTKVQF